VLLPVGHENREPSLTRYLFSLLLLAACGGSDGPVEPGPGPAALDVPLTGQAVPGMESFDRVVSDLMQKHKVPGGAVAVVKDGRLLYARGFGYADVENKVTVAPQALFRIASVSKPITAVAILKLVEANKLALTQKVLPLIPDLLPPAGSTMDPRWQNVTILNLLQHTGGWDRDRPGGFDPMFRPGIAAAAVGAPAPAGAETVIRYMLGQPLDFDPGTRYVYSNFGYVILGRVIERVSGMTYESYVKTAVLAPAGITTMRIGRTRLAQRAANEVKYYQPGSETVNADLVSSVFPGEGQVPSIYGGFHLEAMDAHGGWLASAVDLARFGVVTDGRPTPADIISAGSIAAMTDRDSRLWPSGSFWYGLGWAVRPPPQDNWWHDGSLPGTSSLLVRSYHGFTWAAVFNARTATMAVEMDQAMWTALAGVSTFPSHDLFPQF
jgi:CubicO group peptidase (beta-lactamase class C family)